MEKAIFIGGPSNGMCWPRSVVMSHKVKINKWDDSTIQPSLDSPIAPDERVTICRVFPGEEEANSEASYRFKEELENGNLIYEHILGD